jgi:sugar phosphate isomerase/epimerase
MSTRLFDGERLRREHLAAIATHGFEAFELFAATSHFDHHDPAALFALIEWLRETGLEMPSVRAPLLEATSVLDLARHLPFTHLVVALEEMRRDEAIRTLEDLHHIAEPLGVTVALEVADNTLSTAEGLVDLIENDLEGMKLGICMDVGHASLLGDPAEAIELAAGYLIATHLHDNNRQHDDHLVPFQGAIDWAGTVMAFEKIGYDGVFMFDVKTRQSAGATLERSARARHRLETLAGSWELEAGSFS